MAGLYIHIPFCKQACYYCDFHFSTNLALQSEVSQSIAHEIGLQKEYLNNESLDTIYFGGGTPSVLHAQELELIFSSIHKNFQVSSMAEITVEANPDDITPEKIKSLKTLGANRLSIGIQSFDDCTLKFINRSHNGYQAEQAIAVAKEGGFANISLDLIYAIPGRNLLSLQLDLKKMLNYSPNHISAYSLTVEEKTVFGRRLSSQRFTPTDEEENAHQFELILNTLSNTGYDHYEISNYAQPGFISQHNSNYWKQKKYLGVGPSAHSFDGNCRQANVSNNHTYVESIRKNMVPSTKERLSRENHINEYMMTSLRTTWGCDLMYLIDNFQFDLLDRHYTSINSFIDNGLMIMTERTLLLTRTGKLHADKIISDLFLVD